MSKMPAKKKSCFQITSVTTAQATSSITEDTESLDDPDESRTEDVSSEIFDVSRATDYGPEEEAAADQSSSEETLNNVGEDTPGTMSPNVPPEGSLPGTNVTMSKVVGQPSPLPPVACSSRFRVIKLDHGSGEPYRRGRWTCTEYYDKEPDSTGLSRAADTIRHTSGAYEHSADRDSGLGATGGSLAFSISHQAPDSIADSSALGAGTHMAWQQPSPLGGAAYPAATGPSQQMMVQSEQAYPPGINGKAAAPQNVSLASTSVTGSQPQQFSYSQGQLIGVQAPGQHVTVMPAQGSTQKMAPSVIGSPSSLPGQQLQQAGGVQFVGLHPKSSDSVSHGSGHPVHIQPPGSVAPATVSSGAPQPQKPISQQQATGGSPGSGVRGSHHAISPVVQNVPSTGVSGLPSSAPSVSAIPVTMPIPPATFVQSPLSSHTSVSRSNSLIPAIGLPPVQGTTNMHSGQFATQPMAGQLDDRRKSEPLPQPPIPLISEKSFVKVPITDSLTNPLHLPVFGLPIPVDGEDDSSSSANVVAIDNKIEQAMDLVKSHLMYAVREEVEVLREQIKELIEKNSTLERENALLKSLSNSDQLSQLSSQAGSQQQPPVTTAPQIAHPPQQPNVSSA